MKVAGTKKAASYRASVLAFIYKITTSDARMLKKGLEIDVDDDVAAELTKVGLASTPAVQVKAKKKDKEAE